MFFAKKTVSRNQRHCKAAFEQLEQRTLLSCVMANPVCDALPPASQLVFLTQPVNTVAGTELPKLKVAVEDQYGRVEICDNSDVTIQVYSYSSSGGPPTLYGTLTEQAMHGVASFKNLSLDTAGSYTLGAYDLSDGLDIQFQSNNFTITPAAAASTLFIEWPPNDATPGQRFTVEVELFDQYGNVATNDDSYVSLSLLSGPKHGVLRGKLTAAVHDGVATFKNVRLSRAGRYALLATDSNQIVLLATLSLIIV